jgi:hypothetical protein
MRHEQAYAMAKANAGFAGMTVVVNVTPAPATSTS